MSDVVRVEKVATGIQGLDRLTRGGIPRGRATLVSGKAGSGKSILALQMACNLALDGRRTLVIAVEESPDDLTTSAASLGYALGPLLDTGALRITDLTHVAADHPAVVGVYDVSGLLDRIAASVKDGGAEVVVLDSSTALFSPRPSEERLRHMFFQLVHGLRGLGLTTIVTAEAPDNYGQTTVLGVEDFVCDLVITLRNVEDGERRRWSLEVQKYRRSPHYKGEYPCTISERGMVVFTLDARDRELPAAHERFESGVPGLDEMCGGGWLHDAIVLVRGPTGSGKTIMAGMYALAGVARRESVIYSGFEEPKPVLLRNFAGLGLGVAEAVDAGSLHVRCRYPEAVSPEDILIDLRDGMSERKPALVVLDSISSIEHATSPSTFRHFMISLASLLREHGRSALLTQTIPAHAEADMTAPFLSTVADAIVTLDYTTNEDRLRRTLRVLKMRGSEHITDRRPFVIERGGLRVAGVT